MIFVHGQTQVIRTNVDDTDARIKYSSDEWSLITRNEAFDKTEHLTRQQGATANFTFDGNVSLFKVFGIVVLASLGGNTTTSTYFLDDDPDGQSFTAPGNLTVTEIDMMFYQSPSNLSNGTHTLRIVNDNSDSWYIIDFLTVLSLSPSSNGSTISSTVSHDTPSSSASSTAVSAKTSPSSAMESTNNTGSAPMSLITRKPVVSPGAAAGIALSSAIILGIFVAILLFIYHRRRRKNTELAKLTAIDPFVEGFLGATNNNPNDGKREFSPSGSPAAVETSAHGMFYPYMVEFFSRSKGPRSLKSLISPSKRSGKLNVSPMSVPPLPVKPTLTINTNTNTERPRPLPPPPPQPSLPPPPRPPPVTAPRRSIRRNTKFSFLSNLSGGKGRENDISPASPTTTTDVQMGIAI
ncbi:hypothetical protein Clacol_009650 [Clathrus columnatus]|uniref:Uncharacterized protein n=1 Tax=Clathrus columnatus TaxID=1419009 RepID=A0AAV5AL78_9AGAM|nr:hypothetical protein Clacol_009650 [Clathrus columnatus]